MNTHRSNAHPQTNGKRNLTAYSCAPLENCRRDSLLRSSWNQITGAFKSKPEPRSSWYETATGDLTPWKQVVVPIRAAILAAHASGDKQLLATTLENARAFCRELEADFTSLVPCNDEASILAVALDETKHQGPADEAAMALAANPACPSAAERAIGPLNKHYLRLGALLDKCRAASRAPRASSMAVVR